MIDVRRCSESDLPRLRAREPGGNAGIAENHLRLQAGGTRLYAAAWNEDDLMGSAVLDFAPAWSLPELKHLFIDEQFRRQGAADALCEWIEQAARASGFEFLYLGVDPANEAARALYAKRGYESTGRFQTTTYRYPVADGTLRTATENDEFLRKKVN